MVVKGKAEKEDKSEHSIWCDHATNNKEKYIYCLLGET